MWILSQEGQGSSYQLHNFMFFVFVKKATLDPKRHAGGWTESSTIFVWNKMFVASYIITK